MNKDESKRTARITIELEDSGSKELYTQLFMHCDYQECKLRHDKTFCHDGNIMSFSFTHDYTEYLPKCGFAYITKLNATWKRKGPASFPGTTYEMSIK